MRREVKTLTRLRKWLDGVVGLRVVIAWSDCMFRLPVVIAWSDCTAGLPGLITGTAR
eukprot:COSAG01_NODE_51410_length_355_cov_0.609375_1_plen_56_part_01